MRTNDKSPVDQATAALDAQFDSWDLWRTADGRFLVSVKVGQRSKSASSPRLTDALADAQHLSFLPLVPHRELPRRSRVDRHGPSNWGLVALDVDGRASHVRTYKTKREATEAGEQLATITQERDALWLRKYGWTLDAVEGQHYETGFVDRWWTSTPQEQTEADR